jgi:predicted membrane channel-forming protein YqfA (hemolysin III family)
MSAAALISIPGFTDPFSSLSHLAGAVAAAMLAVPLVRRGWKGSPGCEGRAGRVLSLVVFAVSAIVLLSMSGVYHLLGHEGSITRRYSC